MLAGLMTASNFTGAIPQTYEAELGPVLFEPFARELAGRAAGFGPRDVLELAAGTGILTRRLRDALPAGCGLTATELNAPMLDVAVRKFRDGECVRFQLADAMKLPFGEDAFDLIVCQFGVMFFPDKLASFREVLRVLRPGGRYLFNVWGPMADNPFSEIAYGVGAKFFPDNPPSFYRVPFGYSNEAQIRSDLAAAGPSEVRCETLEIGREVSNWSAFARGLVFGNPLIADIESRGASGEQFMTAVADALRDRFGPAPVHMPLKALVVEAQRPTG
jgi:SAM-dependent methyltransferase